MQRPVKGKRPAEAGRRWRPQNCASRLELEASGELEHSGAGRGVVWRDVTKRLPKGGCVRDVVVRVLEVRVVEDVEPRGNNSEAESLIDLERLAERQIGSNKLGAGHGVAGQQSICPDLPTVELLDVQLRKE